MRYQEPRKRLQCLLSWNGSQVEKRCSSDRRHWHWRKSMKWNYKNIGNVDVWEEKLEKLANKKIKPTKKTQTKIINHTLLSQGLSVSLKDTSACMEIANSIECQWGITGTSTRLHTSFRIYVSTLKFLPEQVYCITKPSFPLRCSRIA